MSQVTAENDNITASSIQFNILQVNN